MSQFTGLRGRGWRLGQVAGSVSDLPADDSSDEDTSPGHHVVYTDGESEVMSQEEARSRLLPLFGGTPHACFAGLAFGKHAACYGPIRSATSSRFQALLISEDLAGVRRGRLQLTGSLPFGSASGTCHWAVPLVSDSHCPATPAAVRAALSAAMVAAAAA